MTQLENELELLKAEVVTMWNLVLLQLDKTQQSLVRFDKDLAREVILKEKRVNAYELKIDKDSEQIFALFCPVAVDLRFVLAAIKINTNLERIGDIAEGIAKYIVNSPSVFDQDLLHDTGILRMYEVGMNMLVETRVSFEREDTSLARSIFKEDEVLDQVNRQANESLTLFIKSHPDKIDEALYGLSIIRKLERLGDQVKNVAEEIIFYVEAKVLKHQNL